MANIKELIQSIESTDSSFDEKLDAINKMEETLVAMRQQEEQAVQDNVDLIVEAIKVMENKVSAQLEIAKSIVPEKGDKGDKGDKGADGRQGVDGKNGLNGRDGKDGVDGADGISVTDAKIDFDGSLVITLSTGKELNVGEVVAPELAEKIKVISTMSTNGAVAILDEGTSITSGVKKINFVGATVTATNSGDDVTVNVSAGTGTVTSVAATAGTGISITGSPITTTGTLAITNTAPDQTVVLTQGGTTTITGTYPNFNISSADQYQGTVTSVTGTSPVASTGGTTPIISMPAATTSVSGYLTSTDWTTFNNKGSGTVTSVTATSPVASTGGATPVISMPAATATINGYLTSTDWSIFNSKGSGSVTSVSASVPTGLSISGSPITTSGTLAITYTAGYAIPTTASQTNWNTAYTERLQWDGGTTGLVAATGRTSLGLVIGTNVLAPNGSAAALTSFPTFNQNTTGTAANVTGIVAIANGGTGLTSGTSGGVLYYSATGTLASSAALSANAIVLGGGAGATPATTTTGTGVVTAIGNAVNNTSGLVTQTATLTASALLLGGGASTGIASTTTGTGVVTALGNNANATGGFATIDGTATLTNKRINPRTSSTASTATLTPDISANDQYNLTAQAVGLTVAAPTGTPVDGNKLIIRILDNGTGQTISWNATYTVIGVTLPTTTTANKMVYVGCIYNSTNTRWDVIAVTTQA